MTNNCSATGAYHTYLCEEVVPFVDARYRTLPHRDHRGITGKSCGGYGGLHVRMRHRDVFGALACHSGDMLFEYCYRPDFPRACSVLQEAGGLRRFLEAFEARPQKGKDDFLTLNIVGMAACYSPEPGAEMGVGLPFDLATGLPREDVWSRWLAHDPLRRMPAHTDALSSLRLLLGRTDVAGFVCIAERGPVQKPTKVESNRQFVTTFGERVLQGYLAYAVAGA